MCWPFSLGNRKFQPLGFILKTVSLLPRLGPEGCLPLYDTIPCDEMKSFEYSQAFLCSEVQRNGSGLVAQYGFAIGPIGRQSFQPSVAFAACRPCDDIPREMV